MTARDRSGARRVLGVIAGLLAVAAATLDLVQRRSATVWAVVEAPAVARIDATSLAHRIRDGSRARIVDGRDSADFAAFTLPGAEPLAGLLRGGDASHRDTLVVFAATVRAADSIAAVLEDRTASVVVVLRGGAAAWITEVLAPRAPAPGASPTELARHREALELANWFGGLPAGIELPSITDSALAAPIVRRGPASYHGC